MTLVKVKDHSSLVRDSESKAILNIDKESLSEHRRKLSQMKQMYSTTERIGLLEAEMKDLKVSLNQILSILQDGNRTND